MYLYTTAARFSPHTGKPITPVPIKDPSKVICDCTGQFLDFDDDVLKNNYNLSIKYNHDSEPMWYEEYHDFEREFGIGYGDFSTFMESPYHWLHTEAYGACDATLNLADEWLKARRSKKKPHPRFYECGTIEGVFSTVRLETLRKLLREKTFTLEQLGFLHRSDTGE